MILANSLSNAPEKYASFNVYVQDESRFGLFTRNGKSLTAKGEKTLVILDNSTIQKSKKFKAKIEQWREKDVLIYFLPRYSLDLFLTEILGRRIEY